MSWKPVLTLSLAAALLAGCADMQNNPKQTAGTVLGGIGGAVIGAQFGKGTGQLVGTAAGALLGAFVGSEVGKSLDRADQQYMQQTTASALNSGQTVTWTNPNNGHAGTVTPQAPVAAQNGQYCREFQQTVTIDGKSQAAYGRACQQPDGSWHIVQ